MNEKPIIFSGAMVKAILEDKKTQTRRVIKPQPAQDPDRSWRMERIPRIGFNSEKTMRNNLPFYCPYGQPGDRLWVRETWAHDDLDCKDVTCGNRDHIWWKVNEIKIVADSFAGSARWRSPIHMPRWASRIDLKIVNVRVERVQEISKADAKAEGMSNVFTWNPKAPNGARFSDGQYFPTVANFRRVWDSLNELRGYSWNSNPWVWVIEFKRAESEICSRGYDMNDGRNL